MIGLWLHSLLLHSLSLETTAQISVERILNALPEGFLIAVFAWALLRVLRRQNAGTRFAIWFLALLTVAALPVLGVLGAARPALASAMARGSAHPAVTIPSQWALYAFFVWVLGACVAMFRLASGFWRLRGLRRSCTPITAANLDPAIQERLGAIGASSITVATSERVSVPAAIGFWQRTIILPAWALRELSPEDLNVILLHEFAHLRRADDWTNLIQKIVRALFFFHPAVWWIENRLSVEREMACDDAVLAATANPHGYANCLVSLLEKSVAHRESGRAWSMAQAAVNRAREASLRLAQILDKNRPAATRVWKPALCMIGTFSMVCLAVLPHAPEFVAVDRGAAASPPSYSTALNRPTLPPSLETAATIPAALGTGELSSSGAIKARTIESRTIQARTFKEATPRIIPAQATAGHGVVPDQAVAGVDETLPPARVVETRASADQGIVPQFRTLVFVESAQYVTFDSSDGSVQVWQVTLVRTVRAQLAKAPVSKTT
jgi:beta-lactamase regulating signal transducer with metallopeptidase domain